MNKVSMAIVALLAAGVAQASVILENDFGGAGVDIGPAFQDIRNAGSKKNSGSADPATGVVTGTEKFTTSGLASDSPVDVTSVNGAAGFTIEWVVESYSGNINDITLNGWFFGVTSGASATHTTTEEEDDGSLFYNVEEAIGIVLYSGYHGNMQLYQRHDGGKATTALDATAPTKVSLEDGFTISLTVNNDNTWSASSTGLSTEINESGTLVGTSALYAYVADSLIANTSIQAIGRYTVDKVTVTAIVPPSGSFISIK